MSTKINLQIHRQPDIDLIDYGVIDIRVWCDILFGTYGKTKEKPLVAVIDTGAPVSLIPQFVWGKFSPKIIQEEAYLSGIIPGPSHMMKTKIGIILAELLDKEGNHCPISFPAHLAPINRVPIIIGMQDVLQKAVVHIDIKGNSNWLEFK